jgi:hypothetical protein
MDENWALNQTLQLEDGRLQLSRVAVQVAV